MHVFSFDGSSKRVFSTDENRPNHSLSCPDRSRFPSVRKNDFPATWKVTHWKSVNATAFFRTNNPNSINECIGLILLVELRVLFGRRGTSFGSSARCSNHRSVAELNNPRYQGQHRIPPKTVFLTRGVCLLLKQSEPLILGKQLFQGVGQFS